jgi:probable F420-dependent oxidoreductase
MVSGMSLPVGVTLPNYGPLAGAASLARLARRAEALGFDSIWVADHLVMPCDADSVYPFDRRPRPEPARLDGLVEFYEPLVTLAYLAAVTSRIRLGVSVYVVPYRNPVVTAKLIATLDALSNGRVIFGAGVGWLREEFRAVGADAARRGRVTDEYLEVCRRLWRDEVSSFSGAHYHLPPVRSGPKPIQRPWPPIWIGGNSSAALTRAVALGDGLHLIDLRPDEVSRIGAELADRLRDAGRTRRSMILSVRSGVVANGDARAGGRAPWTGATLRSDRDAYVGAGVDYFIVAPRQADSVERLEAVLEEVAAALLR